MLSLAGPCTLFLGSERQCLVVVFGPIQIQIETGIITFNEDRFKAR